MPKKMLWKVGVHSCLPEHLIRDGRDSAKRVVSDTDSPKSSLKILLSWSYQVHEFLAGLGAVEGAGKV